jgi:glyoxylase I family protein
MLKAVHHVAIICSNYQKSKDFYVKILGMQVLAENYRAERQSFKLDLALPDGSQVELFSFPDAPPRPSYPEAQGLRHLAFNVEDIEQTSLRLQEHGIIVESIRIDEYTGKKFTFFNDPDGLPLELYQQGE